MSSFSEVGLEQRLEEGKGFGKVVFGWWDKGENDI